MVISADECMTTTDSSRQYYNVSVLCDVSKFYWDTNEDGF